MLVTYDCHSIKRWSIYPTKTTFKILTMRWQFIEPWNWLINFVVSHRNEEPTGDRIRTDICFANTTFFFFLYRFETIRRNIFSKLHRVYIREQRYETSDSRQILATIVRHWPASLEHDRRCSSWKSQCSRLRRIFYENRIPITSLVPLSTSSFAIKDHQIKTGTYVHGKRGRRRVEGGRVPPYGKSSLVA